MSTQDWLTLFGIVGPLVGTFAGILVTNRLTTYRIGQLEEKVNKHNNLVERMTKAECHIEDIEEDIKEIKSNNPIWQPKAGKPVGTVQTTQVTKVRRKQTAQRAIEDL